MLAYMTKRTLITTLFFTLICVTSSLSTNTFTQCYDHPNPLNRIHKVPASCPTVKDTKENFVAPQNTTNMFVVNFTCGISNPTLCAKVKNAFETAGKIISSTLTLNVPINVNASFVDFCETVGDCGNAGMMTLGGASPARSILLQDDDGLARLYPQALVKQFQFENHPAFSDFDIMALFNAAVKSFWFDGDPPITKGQEDFLYVILHEYMHGLGFYSSFDDYFNSVPTVMTPNLYMSVNQTDSSMKFNGFTEMAFDKYMICIPTGKRISSIITGQLNQFVGKSGTVFTNMSDFSSEFKSSPQYVFALNMMKYVITPYTLGFLPHGSNKSSEAIVLETSLKPYEQGSSVSHVDYKTYDKTPDFLMKYLADRGANLTALVAARGTSGLPIGPKLKLLLETLGYESPDNPNPYRPSVYITSNSYINGNTSISPDGINTSGSLIYTRHEIGKTLFFTLINVFIVQQLIMLELS